MYKFNNPYTYIILTSLLVINIGLANAQTWDMHQWIKSVKKVKAEVVGIDRYQRTLTLKVVTNSMTGEYKQGWCFVDDNTKIIKSGKLIELSELRERDQVNVGGIVYRDSRKACQLVQVIE